MIGEEFIKIGQKFKSQVNGDIFEIIKISKNYLGTYVMIKNKKNKISETCIDNFKHLLLDIIKEG